MCKRLTRTIGVFLFLFVMSATIRADVFFEDNFEDGNFDGWTVLNGTWLIGDGCNSIYALRSNGRFDGRIFHELIPFSETLTIEYDLKITGDLGHEDGDILINYQDNNNYYSIELRKPGDTRDGIALYLDGERTVLYETSEIMNADWWHVRIERTADRWIRVYLNDNLHMEVQDSAITEPGDLVLRTWDWDVSYDNFVVSGEGCYDPDEDGLCYLEDNCPYDWNPDQNDADMDEVGDACDNCTSVYNPEQYDYDFDGIGAVCDDCIDTDGDGYGNPEYAGNTCPDDNCPDDFNDDQSDSDADGVGDVCDNCPDDYNPDQNDADNDGYGDICDNFQNIVHIDVADSGGTESVEQLYVGREYKLRIWIENSVNIMGLSLGFIFSSDYGTTWDWLDVDGLGFGEECIKVEEGCRMYPPMDIWELGGLMVSEFDMDGTSPDSILVGGAAMFEGLSVGELEHMISIYFRPTGEGLICIDSAFMPPSGNFYFSGVGIPIVTWPSGGLCLPVIEMLCGDADGSDAVNLLDITFLINYLYKDGPAPDPIEAGDADGSGTINLLDITYLINYLYKDGPDPKC